MTQPSPLLPLGVLADTYPVEANRFTRENLLLHRDELQGAERSRVVDYLSAGTLVVAWMEITTDLIEQRFQVPGGSAVYSDGRYFWRGDASNYVREYGIGIPDLALAHLAGQGWQPPVLTDQSRREIEQRLLQATLPEDPRP